MTGQRDTAQSALGALLSLLDLETLDTNLFRGTSPQIGLKRIFGGQVLAQSLVAAMRTITEPRPMHSLHSYFLLAGDPKVPVIYEVERVRDGGSFTTRRVKAIQNGRAIFVMSASFQRIEEGFDHQVPMPQVPTPEQLPDAREIVTKFADQLPPGALAYLTRERPIELRLIGLEQRYQRTAGVRPEQHVWLRAAGSLPDDERIHQCVLAYASDFTLLDTALIPHGRLMFDADLQLASLDHAIWMHRRFRADDWLLYAQESPSASGARGLSRGSVYRRDGTLIATVMQEGLMRKRAAVTPASS
jgi:acyl-CoA thioesterase-2